jgi:hypothetical protein
MQLMQKFVPWSRVWLFHNERTRSTPVYPKLMLWCVLYILDVLWTISLQHETRCKTGQTGAMQKFVPRRCVGIFRNERIRSTPLDHKNMFWYVSYSLGAFGTVLLRYNTKLGAKRVKLVQLMQKFVPRRCVRIFRDKRTQSTPLDPKHIFWCVLYSLDAFGTVFLPYKTNFKMGRTGAINAKVCATKSCQNFSQRTHQIQSIVP